MHVMKRYDRNFICTCTYMHVHVCAYPSSIRRLPRIDSAPVLEYDECTHSILAVHSVLALTLSYRFVGLLSTGPAGMAGSVWSGLY